MRITVVGGSSGTGAQVVKLAAQKGHLVTCVSRSGATELPDGVRDIKADALQTEAIRSAISGADAVVVTVGGVKGSSRHRAQVTRSVVAAMQDVGVRRLIVQSSLGVGDSTQLMPGPARLFARLLLANALADHAEQEAAVAESGLDWTVLRPGGLSSGPETGGYLAQETAGGRPMKGMIARADVAAHIVSILDDPETFGRALALGTA